jgi:chemotaxis protein MotB
VKKRRQESLERAGTPVWLITYSDLMTLMFSFFIILISFSVFEQGNIINFVGSFLGAFKILPGGFKTSTGEQVLLPSKEILKTSRELSDILTRTRGVLKKEGIEKGVEFKTTNQGLEVAVADYLLFGLQPSSTDISHEMKLFLDELAETVRDSSYLVSIEGHTDDLPLKTEHFPSSWELSTARAVTILRYLIDERGMSPLRLKAAGFGHYRPLVPNDTPEHRAQNRRVVIRLQPNELAEDTLKEKPLFKEGVVKGL